MNIHSNGAPRITDRKEMSRSMTLISGTRGRRAIGSRVADEMRTHPDYHNQLSSKSYMKSESPVVKEVRVVKMVRSLVTATGIGKNFKFSFKWHGKSFLPSFHCWRTLGSKWHPGSFNLSRALVVIVVGVRS